MYKGGGGVSRGRIERDGGGGGVGVAGRRGRGRGGEEENRNERCAKVNAVVFALDFRWYFLFHLRVTRDISSSYRISDRSRYSFAQTWNIDHWEKEEGRNGESDTRNWRKRKKTNSQMVMKNGRGTGNEVYPHWYDSTSLREEQSMA